MAWTQRRRTLKEMFISLKIKSITNISQNSNKCSKTEKKTGPCVPRQGQQ